MSLTVQSVPRESDRWLLYGDVRRRYSDSVRVMAVERPQSPRGHHDPELVASKVARLDEAHIRPLTDLVRKINYSRGSAVTPWFDPHSGGVSSRVLFLLECPGRMASTHLGSGFISADNDDQTAANFFTLREEAGLRRDVVLNWNVVPWYLPAGSRTANASSADVREAAPWLTRLIDLLPNLALVVPMGRRAQQGWTLYEQTPGSRQDLLVRPCPHPSPLALNGRPERRDEIRAVMTEAAALIR